ncbi:cobalamin-dependent protein [Roseibium aquae]|nr:cobalamin-dependent protein [Roseibium aquae]
MGGYPQPLLDDLMAVKSLVFSSLAGMEFKSRVSTGQVRSKIKSVRSPEIQAECRHFLELAATGCTDTLASALQDYAMDPFDRLCLMQETIRLSGEEWTAGNMDFLKLTTSVSRMQTVLRRSAAVVHDHHAWNMSPRIAILLPRNEQHVFAARLVEEHFRIRGWTVRLLQQRNSPQDMADELRDLKNEVVCLSWSSTHLSKDVFHLVETLHAALKGSCLFLAGGPAALEKNSGLFKRGIDKVLSDTYLAIEHAERHVLLEEPQFGGRKV